MDTDQIIKEFLSFAPDGWAVYAPFILLTLSGVCNLLAVGLKPPIQGSPHYATRKIIYLFVTWGALNFGRAANRLQCERTGLLVKRDEADTATSVLKNAGINVLSRADRSAMHNLRHDDRSSS